MQIGAMPNSQPVVTLSNRQQQELPVQLSADERPAATPETTKAVAGVADTKPQANSKDAKEKPLSASELADAIKKLNETVKLYKGDLQFTVDEDTQLQVVKVVDRGSKELIRQIPSPEVVRIAKAIDEFSSLFIRDQA
jgi:flagellar protein FlaG